MSADCLVSIGATFCAVVRYFPWGRVADGRVKWALQRGFISRLQRVILFRQAYFHNHPQFLRKPLMVARILLLFVNVLSKADDLRQWRDGVNWFCVSTTGLGRCCQESREDLEVPLCVDPYASIRCRNTYTLMVINVPLSLLFSGLLRKTAGF